MSILSGAKTQAKRLFDGWSNIYTGMGTTKDRSSYTVFKGYLRKTDEQLVNQYASDGLCAKIIDMLPNEMLRGHVNILHDKKMELEKEFYNRLDMDFKINQALRWARLFGGAVIIPIFDESTDNLLIPFNLNEIKKPLNSDNILVIDRRNIIPVNYLNGAVKPEYYSVIGLSKNFTIHKSRMVIFDGIDVTSDTRCNNNSWGESIINRLDDGLKAFGVGYCNSLSSLISEIKIGVIKLDGLNEKISSMDSSNSEQDIMNKLAIINMSKSFVQGMVLDKNDEFTNVPINLSGLKYVLQGIKDLISTLSGIPHDRLFNEKSGTGLADNGNNQLKAWYDTVAFEQNAKLSKQMQQLLNIVAVSIGINENIDFEFKSLYQMTEKEEAEICKLESEAKKNEVDMYLQLLNSPVNLYTPDEIRKIIDEKIINRDI